MVKKYICDLRREFSGYNGSKFTKDLMAGITVAAVALPFALAFSVSAGADAAAGLITAIFSGIICGLLGGASFQISGPTGTMSAVLMAVAITYKTTGILTVGLLAGAIMLLFALFRIGKLVSYIPNAVIMGFTSGVAIIIALSQVDSFFGVTSTGTTTLEKLASYFQNGFDVHVPTMAFGLAVVLLMVIYPKKLQEKFPSSLAALIVTLIANMLIFPEGGVVAEVGDIPSSLMTSEAILKTGIDFKNISAYIAPAFSVAVLGMVESLLCGASAGKMKGEKVDLQRELVAQGVGNMIIPLFGGVPTAAVIARTSVGIKNGGQTRLVNVIHSITLILSMFLLGSVMKRIPLSALAGILMVTAWRLNNWENIGGLFKDKLFVECAQFLVTMLSTVIFDLATAIVIGIVFSALVFIVKSCNLKVTISNVDRNKTENQGILGSYKYTKIVYLSGPMFFGTQDRLTDALAEIEEDTKDVIFSMRGVPSIDSSAIIELAEIYDTFTNDGIRVLFSGVDAHVMRELVRNGFVEKVGAENFLWDAVAALRVIERDVFISAQTTEE